MLEACRSATVGKTAVFRSVAPRLIQAGVGSVLSMGHAVHVEAARLLLDRFYRELVRGTTIGHAVAQARSALLATPGALDRIRPRRPHHHAARTGSCRTSTSAALDEPLLPPDAAGQQPVRQFDVFLSHNHNDSARVEALARTARGKARPARVAGQVGVRARQAGAAVREGHPRTAASRSSSARRPALDSKWVQWEIDKHNELNPEGDRLHPDQVRAARSSRPNSNDLLWVDFTDPAKDADNAASLARLIRSADAEDARRRRGFRPPAGSASEPGAFPAAAAVWLPGPGAGALRAGAPVPHASAASCCTPWAAWARPRSPPRPRTGGRAAACSATAPASSASSSSPAPTAWCRCSAPTCDGPKFDQLPAAEQRRRAIEFFQQNDVLMVWDNFESALPQFNDGAAAHGSPYTDDERRRLAELFRDLTTGPGQGCLLVTCRPGDTGLPGARRYELHGLARADSLWLLLDILKRDGLTLERSPAQPRQARSAAATTWRTIRSRWSWSARTCAP